MPRWKTLPDELDPEVREFTGQLRRLLDRGGLGVAAVADRTGYSRTSWERYLNGRLLPPKGAVVALAEATDTNPAHLITMWELAERAWSRSEMRHDMTMEQIRISQARAALGEPGDVPEGAPGVVPRDWGTPPRAAQAPGPGAHAPQQAPPRQGTGGGRRKPLIVVAAVVGVLLVVVAAVLLTGLGGDGGGDDKAAPTPSPSRTVATSAPALPTGVQCAGAACTGKDPEAMGCSGQYAATVSTATVGASTIEVRYSKTCGAAWARITQAVAGDSVRITGAGGSKPQSRPVAAAGDAYTPMLAVPSASAAKACATLATGVSGCTTTP